MAEREVNEGSRWLLLIHQIPPKPAYFRAKVGKRLQRLGAVPIKNSVYVLPLTATTQEDFQWVVREIVADGGEATLRDFAMTTSKRSFTLRVRPTTGKLRKRSATQAPACRRAWRATTSDGRSSRPPFIACASEWSRPSPSTSSRRLGARRPSRRFCYSSGDCIATRSRRRPRTPVRWTSRAIALEPGSRARTCTSTVSPAPGSSAASSIRRRPSSSCPRKATARQKERSRSTCSKRTSRTSATSALSRFSSSASACVRLGSDRSERSSTTST